MAKTLKEMITLGHVNVSYQDTNDAVNITRKRYDEQTGEEVAPQTEEMTREQVEYFIKMREQQLADLQELLKVFPDKVAKPIGE
jgi:hypothetical protein